MGWREGAPPVSRIVSVCLCAIVALTTLSGSFFVRPASVFAASGTLSIATPLHESPSPGAPLTALLTEGTIVSIDGPPVDGFYPVTAGTVSGWMRGETLLLEKDVLDEGTETVPPVAEPDGMAPVEQTANGDPALTETPVATDPATDPATSIAVDPGTDPTQTAEVPVAGSGTDTEWTEPAGDVAYDDPNAKAIDPAPTTDTAGTTDGSAPTSELAPVAEAAPVAAPVPANDAAPMNEQAPVDAGSAPPAPESPPALEVAAESTPDPNVTPVPAPAVAPVGPASVIVDAPIRAGPGPSFDLIFSVPRGSTL